MCEATMNARQTLNDAVLAQASENIDGEDVINGLLWAVENGILYGSINGPGRMVDFSDYKEVSL